MSSWPAPPSGLRQAARGLATHRRFATSAVLAIALGAGTAGAMFGIIDRLYFRPPRHVTRASEIVRVYVSRQEPPLAPTTSALVGYPVYAAIRDGVRGFEQTAAFTSRHLDLGRGSTAQRARAQIVTASYFTMLGVRPYRGRFFAADEARAGARLVVVSQEFWRSRLGGDPLVLGRTLSFASNDYQVVGIAPAGFRGTSLEPVDVWLPMETAAEDAGYSLDCLTCAWLAVAGLRRPGLGVEAVRADVAAALRGARDDPYAEVGAELAPLQEARGPIASPAARLAAQLGGLAMVVLLIACTNVANLMAARAGDRRQEIAIRLSLGARWSQAIRHLLIESLLISAIGGVGSVLVAAWGSTVLVTYLLPSWDESGFVDTRLLGFAACVVCIVAVVAAVAPAVRMRDTTIATRGSRERPPRSLARSSLVALQVGLTFVLIVGAGLFIGSLRNVNGLALGLEPEHLVSASMDQRQSGLSPPEVNRLYRLMRDRVSRLPGVESASLSIGTPFQASLAIGISAPGVPDSAFQGAGAAYIYAVSPDYFRTLGTRLLRGRLFQPHDDAGSGRVAIVNDVMARRLWGADEPIGKCLHVGNHAGTCSEVVGVVEEVRRIELIDQPTMQYYVPLAQVDSTFPVPVTSLLVRTIGGADEMAGTLRGQVQGASPDLPFVNVVPMTALYEWQLRPWRLGSTAFGLFGVLALALAAVGLYELMSYVVSHRTRELGIRFALGANPRGILARVVGDALRVVAVGILLGVAASLYAGRLLASLLYGVSPTSGTILLTTVVLMLVVAVAASWLPARRATMVDPAVALRAD